MSRERKEAVDHAENKVSGEGGRRSADAATHPAEHRHDHVLRSELELHALERLRPAAPAAVALEPVAPATAALEPEHA
eukprot:SAG11_NODE_9857_length_875_cov_0.990979_2_plen_78_part_00